MKTSGTLISVKRLWERKGGVNCYSSLKYFWFFVSRKYGKLSFPEDYGVSVARCLEHFHRVGKRGRQSTSSLRINVFHEVKFLY